VANWCEPILKGELPAPRKAAAAAATGSTIYMFGGQVADPEVQLRAVDELVVLQTSGSNNLIASINPDLREGVPGGQRPAARAYATMQVCPKSA
jgi:dynein heavy chain